MEFNYHFVNSEHIPPALLRQAEEALQKRAYVCQQEFERLLDMYHEINLFDLPETTGEAVVSGIEIDGNDANVTLDLSSIRAY